MSRFDASHGCDWEPWLAPKRLIIRLYFVKNPSRRWVGGLMKHPNELVSRKLGGDGDVLYPDYSNIPEKTNLIITRSICGLLDGH